MHFREDIMHFFVGAVLWHFNAQFVYNIFSHGKTRVPRTVPHVRKGVKYPIKTAGFKILRVDYL